MNNRVEFSRRGKPACRAVAGVWLLPLVLFCSCAGLPERPTHSAASRVQTQSPQPPRVAAPQQMSSVPAVAAAPAPPSTGYVALAGHHTHAGHAIGAAPCPHCGPGTLPPFAFRSHSPEAEGLPWRPDGIKGPGPPDEYVCDGGDLNHDAFVKADRTVVGLDQQDTIAHYDTVNGRHEVSASNCVCIYAPRFAAVRQVSTPILQEGHERMADVVLPARVNIHEEARGPRAAVQPEQIVAQIGLDQPQRFRDRTRGLLVDQAVRLVLAGEAFLPHENLRLIERGIYEASEGLLLAERVAAAIVWTQIQAPQVLIAGQPAVEMRGTATPQVTFTYELEGKGCLRLCKIADKSEAKPGEIVQFTVRFDNVGDQPIENVTIIDHLVPRLEYVAGSAESSVKAQFSSQEQQPGESLVLRWDLQESLGVNQGGIVRFQARVR